MADGQDARIDRQAARRRASRAAPTYLDGARLEAEVGSRMLERLDYVRVAPQRILDAGCGPAPQAPQLARRYRGAQILALDHSRAMLARAVAGSGMLARLLGRSAPRRVCADLDRMPIAAGTIGLAWSNMALHWLDQPLAALREIGRVLAADGLLMFSTLGPATLKELRSACAAADGCPRVHAFIDMHDLGDMLLAAGFADPVMDMETLTLTYRDAHALFADLRATGQTSSLAARPRGLLGRTRFAAIVRELSAQARDGRIPATFEVIYGHAWKGVRSRTADGAAIVRTDLIRSRRI